MTGPHDLQPDHLDLGVHEESVDEPGVDKVPTGTEFLDSQDDMDEDNEITFVYMCLSHFGFAQIVTPPLLLKMRRNSMIRN
jgi:hypothetical protein